MCWGILITNKILLVNQLLYAVMPLQQVNQHRNHAGLCYSSEIVILCKTGLSFAYYRLCKCLRTVFWYLIFFYMHLNPPSISQICTSALSYTIESRHVSMWRKTTKTKQMRRLRREGIETMAGNVTLMVAHIAAPCTSVDGAATTGLQVLSFVRGKSENRASAKGKWSGGPCELSGKRRGIGLRLRATPAYSLHDRCTFYLYVFARVFIIKISFIKAVLVGNLQQELAWCGRSFRHRWARHNQRNRERQKTGTVKLSLLSEVA